jgi:hypothetical protein
VSNRRSGVAKLKIKEMGSRYFLSPMSGWRNISAWAITGGQPKRHKRPRLGRQPGQMS